MNINIIGDKVAKLEFGDDDITDVTYQIHLEGGEVLKVWNGNSCYIAYDTAIGANVGARLISVELQSDHKGDEYLHFRFE